MLDVLIVARARPNFMKVKPVLDAVEDRGLTTLLVHTGQHYDAQMSDVFFTELGMRPPDRSPEVGSGTHVLGLRTEDLMQLLAGPQPRVHDVDPTARLLDQPASHVGDAHRLTHVEHEGLTALAHGTGLDHELHRLLDGQK